MTAQPPHDRTDGPSPDDDAPAGGTNAWWWSPGLMLVVGVVVIVLQVDAYSSPDGGMWLNAVMIAIGAVVAAFGAVGLWRAWQKQNADGGPTAG